MADLPSYDDLMKSGRPVDAADESKVPSYDDLMTDKPNKNSGLLDSLYGSAKSAGDSILEGTDDLAKSVGQGATLGGGDEILGALQASGDVLTGDAKLADWLKKYREHQKDNEAEYDEVKKRSPTLSTVGEIGGGFLLPGGALIKGGKALGAAGRIALATGTGLTTGALSSHGDLDEGHRGELAEDSAIGGILGGTLQATGEAAAPYVKKAAGAVGSKFEKAIENYPMLRQHYAALKEGLEGRGFLGDKNRTRLADEVEEKAKNLTDKFDDMRGVASEEYGKVMGYGPDGKLLPNAPTIDPSKIGADDLKSLSTADTILDAAGKRTGYREEAIAATLAKLKNGEQLQAQEVKDLQKYLRDNAGKINQGETMDQVLAAKKAADKILNSQVPGYTETNKLFQKVESPIDSFITNTPADQLSVASQPSSRTMGTKQYQTAKKVIETAERPFMGGQGAFEQLNQLKKGLKELESSNPDMLKRMGIDNVDEFMKGIRNDSDIQAVYKTISGTGSLSQTGDIIGTGLRLSYGASNAAGLAGNTVAKMGRKLYSLPAEHLSSVSQSLQSNPATAFLGNALEQSVQNPGSASKNAILFSIMQNPEARKQVEGVISGVKEE
jgi:hypothetical protein